ncbi:MAG TPA: NAD(P)H-binding protein [Agromyces sp.]|nr:NAD(P)H-binding protein [Agromyces sp.]
MIAVSGASGNLGRLVARDLLDAVDADRVRLITRSPDALYAPPGVDVRAGDMNDADTLRRAYDGVETLLVISTDTVDGRSAQHIAAIDAAKDAGVGRVVYTSMISPTVDNPALIATSHRETEEHLLSSGVDWTIVRCGLYGDFQGFEAADALRAGQLRHNRGPGRCAYIAREDCAASIAAVLSGSGHAGIVYELTGPAAPDADELGALYAEAGGAPVEVIPLDDEVFLDELAAASGADGHVHYGVALTVSLGRAIREGHFASVTDTVRRLSGREPIGVAELLGRQQELLRSATATR